MKRILLLFLTLNLGISYAQTGGTAPLEANPKWFLGMDLGGTWMQSDLKKDYAGMGFSFQLGKYFYRKPTRFFDAAWRFRYLHGVTFGFDDTRTDISQNSRFNGTFPEYSSLDYTNDTINKGYIFQNYRMEFNRYALELLIGFNRLRENTGIVLNLFGGIGFTAHRSKMDQLSEFGGRYDYSNLDTAGTVSLSDLNDVHGETPRDLDFESYVPGYTKNSIKVLPSLGFEFGYQFGKYFAMGIGHKVTFTLRDDMDGMVATTGRQSFNDRYHYSNLYFKFYLGGGGSGHHHHTTNTHTTTTTTTTVTPPQAPVPTPMANRPVIHYTYPAACPTNVTSALQTIKANIYYINSGNQIVFKVNGNVMGGFNYSSATQQFTSAPLTLMPGDNIIEIKATNEAGSDYQSCVINYQTTIVTNPGFPTPTCYAPVITVHNPNANTFNTSTSNINIVSTILNIENSSQISYRVNGVLTSGFYFDASNGSFSSSIGLNEGANTIEIKATNLCGQDKEIITVNYTKPQTIQPPIVTIYNPAINPHTVSVNSGTVNATVLNVTSAANILVSVNGINYTGFTFNPATHQLVLTTPLIAGANVVQITGTNAAGTDSENTTIIYQPVVTNLPPVVTYTDPIVNPYSTTMNTKLINATVTNVTAVSGISVKLNGSPVTGFSFVNTTGHVAFTATLVNGANVVEIKGTNPYGSDSKSTTIIYNKVNTGLPPVVAINYPMSNPYNTTVSNETVSATVLNVASAANINVTVNGTSTTAFSYNTTSKVLTLPLTLATGTTVVTIKGTNAYGTDSKSTTLVYSVPCSIPTITPVNPSTSSYTTGVSPFNFIAIATNITNASQIEFKFNGVVTPFIFDASTGSISATLTLLNGGNVISVKETNNCGTATLISNIIYAKPLVLPVVNYINPSVNPYNVTASAYTINASILNVTAVSGVSFKQNGTPVTAFTFNPSTHAFSSNVTLTSGANVFELTGTNTDGSDSKTTVIVYSPTPPPCNMPVVAAVSPSGLTTTTTIGSLNLLATVTNASSSEIVVKHNGTVVPFTLTGTNLSATITLATGVNNINIKATTSCGSANLDLGVVYTHTPEPPVVTITNPGVNPYTATSASLVLQAKIYHVTSSANVTFKINGVASTDFTFNPATNDFSANYVLTSAATTFEIKGTNTDGTDSETQIVNYSVVVPECNKPIVMWLSPSGPSVYTIYTASYVFKAIIENIASSSDITGVQLNGVTVPYTYDNSTHKLIASVTLLEGTNVITITAKNDCGTVTENFVITYDKPAQPPVVTITKPAVSGTTVTTASYTFEADIQYVPVASGVTCSLNGNPVTTFTYNTSTGKFTLAATLASGDNTLEVTGANADGNDSKTTTIKYSAPVPPCVVPGITLASTSASVSTTSYTLTGTVTGTGVTSSSVVVKNNGVVIPFTLTGTDLSVNCSLTEGTNIITIAATNACGNDNASFTVNYTPPPPPCTIPNVTLPSPAAITVTNDSYTLTGTAIGSDLTSASIVVKQNGVAIPFTLSGSSITIPITLVSGSNAITVTATNGCGSDNGTFTITYNPPPPCIVPSITLPSPASVSLSTDSYTLTGTITGSDITSASVVVKKNGTAVPFTLDGTALSVNLSGLAEGVSTVTVIVNNSCGNDNASFTVTYTKPVETTMVICHHPPGNPDNTQTLTIPASAWPAHLAHGDVMGECPVVLNPPVVTITNPATPGSTVTTPGYAFTASVTNVNASQITMTVNGASFTGFTYNNGTTILDANLTLIEGVNNITVSATNSDGSDSKSTTIKYVLPCITPAITLPSGGSVSVESKTYTLTGSISGSGVTSASVTVKMNGASIPFTLTGSALSINLSDLSDGANVISIIATNSCGTDNASFTITYNPPKNPPVVTITNPAAPGTTVTSAAYAFKATVTNVTSSQIVMIVDGAPFTGFSYNDATDLLTTNLTLIAGLNSITVTGTNIDGSDSKSTNITMVDPCTAPSITLPSGTSMTSLTDSYTLTGTITGSGITSSSVTVKNNGTTIPFTLSGTSLSVNIGLNEGANVITVKVVNSCGTDNATFTINYTAPAIPNPPVVTINNPAAPGSTVTVAAYAFKATVTNVNASQIAMMVNGISYTGFSYNETTDVLTASLTLNTGLNTINVTGTNADGSDSKSTTITYNIPCTAPAITLPAAGSASVTTDSYILVGTIAGTEITSASVVVKNNGEAVPFTLSGTSLSINLTGLTSGANVITVTATNACGSDNATFTITYTPPVESTMVICHHPPGNPDNTQTLTIPASAWPAHLAHGDAIGECPTPANPPVVTITHPSAPGSTVTSATYSFKADVTHCESSQITMTVNGVTYTGFSYNSSSDKLTASLTLLAGVNNITVTGTNSDGTDSKSTTITYTIPCTAPNVTLPSSGSTSVTADSYTLTGTISGTGVTSASVVVKKNGTAIPFTLSGTSLSVNLTGLAEGATTITVEVTNECGTDNATFTVNYTAPVETTMVICHHPPGNPDNTQTLTIPSSAWPAHLAHGDVMGACPETANPPVVTITTPSAPGTTSTSASYSFKADVTNCESSQITMTVNGVAYTGFSYNSGSDKLTAGLTLVSGLNTITVTGTNSDGSDSKSTTINYTLPCTTPNITLGAAATVNVTSASYTLTGTISGTGITSSSVTVKKNGVNVPFTLTGTSLSVALSLSEGANTISVSATNDCGNDAANTVITYTDSPGFEVSSSGGVTTSTNMCATIKCLGESVIYDNSEDAFVKIGLSTNGGGSWYAFNSNNKIVGGETMTVSVPTGSTLALKGYCYNESGTWNNTLTSNSSSTWVKVLKNGDEAPNIGPAPGQAAVETFLAGVIVDNHITIGPNDVIYLFELRHVGSVGIDYQDAVMLITFAEGSGCSSPTLPFSTAGTTPAPSVTITKPTSSGTTTGAGSYSFKATVTNVTSSQITLTLNGTAFTGFTYDASTDKLTASLPLVSGLNNISVSATNSGGTDSKSTTITRTASIVSGGPAITMTNPATTATTVTTSSFSFAADVTNVIEASQIKMTINDVPFTGFAYNVATSKLTANLTLNPGSNFIEVVATTDEGTATKSTNITYTATAPCVAPVIKSVTPSLEGATLTSPSLNLAANTSGIDNAAQIVLKLNGSIVPGFYFNPSSGSLSKTLTLVSGSNTIQLTATNACGTDTKNYSFKYAAPAAPAPAIKINNPSTGSVNVSNPNFIVSGNVQNVNSQAEISVSVNGVNFTGFIYTPSTKGISIPLVLRDGTTSVVITAANSAGNDSKTVSITYKPIVENNGNNNGGRENNGNNNNGGNNNENRGTNNNGGNTNGGNTNGGNNKVNIPVLDKPNANEANYKKAMDAGNGALNAKNWGGAKAEFQKALGFKPGDAAAKDGIKKAEDGQKAAQDANKVNNNKIEMKTPENKTPENKTPENKTPVNPRIIKPQ